MDKIQSVGSCAILAPCISWACAFIAKNISIVRGMCLNIGPAGWQDENISPLQGLHCVLSRKWQEITTAHPVQFDLKPPGSMSSSSDQHAIKYGIVWNRESSLSVTFECSTSDHLQQCWGVHQWLLCKYWYVLHLNRCKYVSNVSVLACMCWYYIIIEL